jgi:hypothetical protein
MDIKKPDILKSSPVFETQDEYPKVTDVSEDLEYQGRFVASAIRCRDLDWRLAAVDARELLTWKWISKNPWNSGCGN